MLKQYFMDRKKEFVYTALINVLFIVAFNMLFYPRFHSDLDILMQSALYGVAGISSSYIVYSNVRPPLHTQHRHNGPHRRRQDDDDGAHPFLYWQELQTR